MVLLDDNPLETYYCHWDDHSLIRKPENKPLTLGKTISKRFELRPLNDELMEEFDHATERSRAVKAGNESSDCDSD